MALTTVFLVVLIVALLIGNGLLFFVGKKPEERIVERRTEEYSPVVISPATAEVRSIAPVERKLELAHKRIQILEKQIESSAATGLSPTFKRKVEKLDNFRSTVEAELIGIKEILQELQNSNMTAKSRVYKKPEKAKKDSAKKLSGKDMHKLIYKSV
ncbi:MAG: hypothetical protein NUV67_05780 [archaeon]|nr:hypothetical protein [archaeon]